MTQRPKHSAAPMTHTSTARDHGGRHPGAIRPGESRFDARAWREHQRDEALGPGPSEPEASPIAARRGPARGATLQVAHEPEVRRPVGRTAITNTERPQTLRHAVPAQVSDSFSADVAPAAVISAAQSRDGGARWRYLAVWAVLGSVSAAYVAGMAWQRTSNFSLVLGPVTETLERMAGDIADLKQVTTAIDARERATADRVANAESRLNRFADTGMQAAAALGQASGQTSGQRPTSRAALTEEVAPVAAAQPQRLMAGVVLAQPGTPPGMVVGPPPAVSAAAIKPEVRPAAGAKAASVNPVKTGGLQDAPGAVGGRKQSGLLVASGPSLDAMKLSWSVLSQNHGGVLGPVEPRVQQAGDGSIYQLIAGPYATDADAAKACATLRARGVTCRMAEFGGAAL